MAACNKKLIILVLIMVIVTGCNNSLIIKNFRVDSDFYHESGYFLGNSKVDFSVELVQQTDGNITYQWTANGGKFLSQNKRRVSYLTPKVPGDYNILLTIKDTKGNEINYNFPFSVKGDYPDRVILKKVISQSFEEGVKLDWTSYLGDDFYGYKILRSNNFYIDDSAKVIAEVNDKATSSYIDHDINPNQVYTYQIMVINNQGYFSISNEEMVQVWQQGIKEIRLNDKLSDILVDPIRSRAYITNQTKNQILILDTSKEQIIKRIDVELDPKDIVLSKNNKFLFLMGSQSSSLIQLNLDNYEQNKYNFTNQIKDIAINKKYLYLNTEGEYNLLKFNISQQKVESKYKLTKDGLLVSGEEIELIRGDYLLIDEVFGDTLIYKVDDFFKPITNFETGAIEAVKTYELAKNEYIYIASEYPNRLQSFLVDLTGRVKLDGYFNTESYPRDFALNKDKELLFVVCESKGVSVFSTTNYTLKRKIKLKDYVHNIALDNNSEKLYLLTSTIKSAENNIVIVNLK